MIRRFVAKGRDLAHLTEAAGTAVETWINNHPRSILGFATPNSRFHNELKTIA